MIDLIQRESFDETKEDVVILKVLDTIQGGVTLDVTGMPENDLIQKGHVLIKNNTSGVVSPLGYASGKFLAVPASSSYYGICLTNTNQANPFVGVLIQGAVNYKAMPYDTETILSAMKTALININFRSDK